MIFELLLSQALLFGVLGSFLDMANKINLIVYMLLPAVFVITELFIWNYKKIRLLFNIALGALLSAAAIIWQQKLIDGAEGFLNCLFSASESRQAYSYSYYTVPDSESSMIFFVLLCGTAAAIICAVSIRKKNILPIVFLLLFCIFTQIYFGVFSNTVWTLLLFFSFVILTIYASGEIKSISYYVFPFASLVLIVSIVFFAYPGESKTLKLWSEAIRDQLGNKVSYTASEMQKEAENNFSQKNVTAKENREGLDSSKKSQGFLGAHIGTITQQKQWALNLLLIITAAFFIFAAVCLGIRAIKISRYRTKFKSTDISYAIINMFLYLTKNLKIGGLKIPNKDYLKYAEQIEKTASENSRENYERAVTLWQEAAFSEHVMTENQREEMEAITGKIIKNFLSCSSFLIKCKLILFKYFGKIGFGEIGGMIKHEQKEAI